MGFFDRIKRAFTGEDETLIQQDTQQEEKKIIFEQYDKGMEKTRRSFSERINDLFSSFKGVDEDFFDELEEVFITADVGFDMTIALTDALREDEAVWQAKNPEAVKKAIVRHLVAIYEKGEQVSSKLAKSADDLTVILFVGVNGVGKTTTIGKLASKLQKEGNKVLLAAGDTFRAGAIEQIGVWGERIGVPVVEGDMGGDPASVVFDAIKKAKEEHVDYLLVDTAGRLQNKVNLMNELEKIKRIISREIPGGAQEVLLVLDATTGQNALIQAKQFNETTNITGLVLTKLDGTAKGGVVLAIRHELDIPVKFVGLGEGVEDLREFAPDEYMYGLVKDLIDKQYE
ncbi:signal recognition particle-docking protein FtsY [Carnobacteriaceae bacterium zg-ZUI78]|uniref:signal recognition particle-docking protein FtsY n=1 Tax=Granulicatella sp. zg-84 TaxID=2678503 RepID=UPI0013C01C0E|nr:signal recognition particle-docking protein FtsY [Granulicatella sp. zg-84]MBS4750150.1 signal recognition particle-docking protein FtsY [Carnobacteriaceae bacterium zg-ZUI78]NEW65508.1 signal recognition particle-docking protein FtsY [Granulicatella sp. zg-84]QMI85607.1 signal recognition particle-docking protein FtsY [Carnobacteriaceae bacterium zg-84]